MSVYEALVDCGREAASQSDQRVTIKIIQERGYQVREGSVVPDLTAPHYSVPPRPVRPPVPAFASTQAPSSLGKRSRTEAFADEPDTANSRRRGSGLQPGLAATDEPPNEDVPIPSLERSTTRHMEHTSRAPREASHELVHDLQPPQPQNAERVGHTPTLDVISTDTEVKSESPEPQAPFKTLRSTSVIDLEAPTRTTHVRKGSQRTPSAQAQEIGERLAEHRNGGTSVKSASYISPASVPKSSAGGRRDVTAVQPLKSETVNKRVSSVKPLQQLPSSHRPPTAPITPESDLGATDNARNIGVRLSRPASKSALSSVRATSASRNLKSNVRQEDVYEAPESEIEDSQMSPRSKQGSIHRASKASYPPKSGLPRELPPLFDWKMEHTTTKRNFNKPKPDYADNTKYADLSDTDDWQLQAPRETPELRMQHDSRPQEIVGSFVEEESTDRSDVDDEGEGEEMIPNPVRRITPLKYRSESCRHSQTDLPPPKWGNHSTTDSVRGGSDKENNDGRQTPMLSPDDLQHLVEDVEMQDTLPEVGIVASASALGQRNAHFDCVQIPSRERQSPELTSGNHQASIDILNGGRSYGANHVEPLTEPHNDDIITGSKRGQRKKKSQVDGGPLQNAIAINQSKAEHNQTTLLNGAASASGSITSRISHEHSKAVPRSEGGVTTSTEGAGDQLKSDLQMSVEKSDSGTTYLPVKSIRTVTSSGPGPESVDRLPILNKIYNGIVRVVGKLEYDIELRGIVGMPLGVLSKRALSQISSVETPSKLLPGQMLKVRVNRINDDNIILSVKNFHQAVRSRPEDSVTREHGKEITMSEALNTQIRGPTDQKEESKATVSNERARVNAKIGKKTKKAVVDDESAEKHDEGDVKDSIRAGTDDKTGSDVESFHALLSDPEGNQLKEHRMGLDITSSPRKPKSTPFDDKTVHSAVAKQTDLSRKPTRKGANKPKAGPSTKQPLEEQQIDTSVHVAPSDTELSKPLNKSLTAPAERVPRSSPQIAFAGTSKPPKSSVSSSPCPKPKPAPESNIEPSLRSESPAISTLKITDVMDVEGGEEAQLAWIEANAVKPRSLTTRQYLTIKQEAHAARARETASADAQAVGRGVNQTGISQSKARKIELHEEAIPARKGTDKALTRTSKKPITKSDLKPPSTKRPQVDSQSTASPTPSVVSSPTPRPVPQHPQTGTNTRSLPKPKASTTAKPQTAKPTPTQPSISKRPQTMAELSAYRKARKVLPLQSASKPMSNVGANRSRLGAQESNSDSEESESDSSDSDGGRAAAKTRALIKASIPDASIRNRTPSVNSDDEGSDLD